MTSVRINSLIKDILKLERTQEVVALRKADLSEDQQSYQEHPQAGEDGGGLCFEVS